MIIHFSDSLNLSRQGDIWHKSNGATRPNLVIINKLGGQPDEYITTLRGAKLGTLDKGNHHFIFVNPDPSDLQPTIGVFLCESYGYTLIEGKELYVASSVGGYGNSCSKMGIYEVGALIATASYKCRRSPSHYRLTPDGWVFVSLSDVYASEATEICNPVLPSDTQAASI